MRRQCADPRHIGRDATQRFPPVDPQARLVPRRSAARRARHRAASAKSASAGARSWLGYALKWTGNKQNRIPPAVRPLLPVTLTSRPFSCNRDQLAEATAKNGQCADAQGEVRMIVRNLSILGALASRSQMPSSAFAIDAPSRPSASVLTTSAPAMRALSAIQIGRHSAAGNIDDAQPRPAHAQFSNPAARAIRRSRASTRRPALAPDVPGDVAAGAAHTLPRDRFRQHLRQSGPTDRPNSQSTTQSQPSGMASPASTQTGNAASGSGEYDDAPTRSRARKRPAVGGGDVARRKRWQRRHLGSDAAQRFRRAADPPAPPARGRSTRRQAPHRAG